MNTYRFIWCPNNWFIERSSRCLPQQYTSIDRICRRMHSRLFAVPRFKLSNYSMYLIFYDIYLLHRRRFFFKSITKTLNPIPNSNKFLRHPVRIARDPQLRWVSPLFIKIKRYNVQEWKRKFCNHAPNWTSDNYGFASVICIFIVA